MKAGRPAGFPQKGPAPSQKKASSKGGISGRGAEWNNSGCLGEGTDETSLQGSPALFTCLPPSQASEALGVHPSYWRCGLRRPCDYPDSALTRASQKQEREWAGGGGEAETGRGGKGCSSLWHRFQPAACILPGATSSSSQACLSRAVKPSAGALCLTEAGGGMVGKGEPGNMPACPLPGFVTLRINAPLGSPHCLLKRLHLVNPWRFATHTPFIHTIHTYIHAHAHTHNLHTHQIHVCHTPHKYTCIHS